MIKLALVSDIDIEYFTMMQKSLVLPNPSEHMFELYIINMICQHLHLRAELDYSIESSHIHKHKRKGIMNPLFAEIILLIKSVIKLHDSESFTNLVLFINKFLVLIEKDQLPLSFNKYTNYLYHINHSRNIVECLEFIVTKYDIII